MFFTARSVLGILLLALGSRPLAALAQPCTQPDLPSSIQYVKTAQSELLAYKTTAEIDESVPAALQAKIRSFKDALAKLADSALVCAGQNVDAHSLENSLARALDANKPEVQEVYDPEKPPQLDHIYGDDIHVHVSRPERVHHLVLIEFRFGIECGFDSILLAFEQRNGQWVKTLHWQSSGYNEISEAFGDFFSYTVLPKTGKNPWYLAVAHGQPWCTSNWSGFKIDVLQPGGNISDPSVIFHTEAGYKRDWDTSLKPTKNGFQLRAITGSLDMDQLTHPEIFRYEIDGKEVQRVQPIANNGHDFVDVWLQVPWNNASRWSTIQNLAQLEQIHKKIASALGTRGKEFFSANFGPVRSCSDSKAHYQVQLGGEWSDGNGHSRPAQTLYFQIEQGPNSFTMIGAAPAADAHCTGPNIMAEH